MTPEQRAARSSRVRELLADDDVKDALDSVRSDLTDAMAACDDAEQATELWRCLRAFERFRSRLTNWATSDAAALARKR